MVCLDSDGLRFDQVNQSSVCWQTYCALVWTCRVEGVGRAACLCERPACHLSIRPSHLLTHPALPVPPALHPGPVRSAAAYSVMTILQSIQSLLADPNVDSPLNTHAAKLWGVNDAEYRALVQKTYAGPRPAA